MSALSDLLEERTDLGPDAAAHLQQLVGDWQILADLGFADLLLWVRTVDGGLLCVGHVRPTTAPTSHPMHEVGRVAAGELSWLDRALEGGGMVRDRDPEWDSGIPIRPEGIAVGHAAGVIAVLGRDTNLHSPRSPSEMELAYLDAAGELFHMVSEGRFPTVETGYDPPGPRVGDGFIRLDPAGVVRYASPNGVSAFRRMGLTADLLGRELAEVGRSLVTAVDDGEDREAELASIDRLRIALAAERPQTGDLSARLVTVAYRIIPLSRRAGTQGSIVLLRDTTDLRHRDLALRSKDVSIREIHHRVKNNLQTVAALLRLQGRRMHHPAARAALAESVRRVSSIALVHETLAASRDGAADLDVILDSLIPMISEVSAARPGVRFERAGRLGELSAELATPLVMVLTELLHNAVEHGLADRDRGRVMIATERTPSMLTVRIDDDGRGLPLGFSLEASDSLGLQIVRTLVESEMRGSIRLARRRGDPGVTGTEAVLMVPLPR